MQSRMSALYSDQDILKLLRDAVREILKKNHGGPSFAELYVKAYTLDVHKQRRELHVMIREAITTRWANEVRVMVEQSFQGNFYETINSTWSDHKIAIAMIKHIFQYRYRVYSEAYHIEGYIFLDVNEPELIMYKEEVLDFPSIRERLQTLLMNMMEKARKGELVDMGAVKNICEMLMGLGSDLGIKKSTRRFLRSHSLKYPKHTSWLRTSHF